MAGRVMTAVRRSRGALKGTLIFMAATMAVNGANFFYHLIVSRQLDTADYGALGALLGLLLIFAVPGGALQVAVTKEVAARRSTSNGEVTPIVIGPLLAQSLFWGLGVMLALLALSPLIQNFLHLDSPTDSVLLALYAIPTALGVVPRGVLIGEMRFVLVSFAMVVGAVVRLGFGTYLSQTNGLSGALAGVLLGDLVMVAIMLPALRSLVAGPETASPLRVKWSEGAGALVALSGFWALTGADTFLARHFLERNQSGHFAAAATAARAVMFLPAAVAAIAFPYFAKSGGRSEEARRALLVSVAAVGVLGIVAAGGLVLLDDFIIKTLFGERYLDASGVLLPLAFAASALGLISVLMHFHIASNGRMAAAFPWVGVLGAVVGVFFFHDSMMQIGVVMLVVTLSLLLVMAHIAFRRSSQSERQVEWVGRQLWDDTPPDIDLSMVVPYFNPGAGVVETINKLDDALRKSGISYEIIAVSDGSTDGSPLLLEKLDVKCLKTFSLENNSGKGEALRLGLATGRGHYLGFIDADGDVDPELLAPYLSIVKLYQPDIVLGSKRHPMSEVDYPPIRHVYSWGYQFLTYLLFRTRVRDTQTGLKLVRREVLALSLPRMVEKRFAFDLELLVVAKHLGFTKFFEAPIKIDFQFKSTVNLGSVTGMLLDTFAIYYRLHLLRTYDRPISPVHHDNRQVAGTKVPLDQ